MTAFACTVFAKLFLPSVCLVGNGAAAALLTFIAILKEYARGRCKCFHSSLQLLLLLHYA